MQYLKPKTNNMDINIIIIIAIVLMIIIVLLIKYKGNKLKKNTFIVKEIKSILYILITILIIRNAIIEPFNIPSGSMNPTLIKGDIIIVNKFIYGLHLPLIKKKIAKIKTPKQGDIVVFIHSPTKQFYIKRIIGMPNDKIKYEKKKLYINEIKIKNKLTKKNLKIENGTILEIKKFREYLIPNKEYEIQKIKNIHSSKYNYDILTVPFESYYVLGDNRDNSNDSRYWGYVKENTIIGKAIIICINIDIQKHKIKWNRLFKYIN